MERDQLVAEPSARLDGLGRELPLRVAVDGVDAAGKTTLANELALLGRPVIRASVDGFHHPAARRHRRGLSPEGTSRTRSTTRRSSACCSRPSARAARGATGGRCSTTARTRRSRPPRRSPPRMRSSSSTGSSCCAWSCAITGTSPSSWRRTSRPPSPGPRCGTDRSLGGAAEVRRRYEAGYVPGQRIYLDSEQPRARASVVVVNDDPTHPLLEG